LVKDRDDCRDRSGGGETANEQQQKAGERLRLKHLIAQSKESLFITTAMYALLGGFGFGLFAAGSGLIGVGAGGVLA